MSVRRVRALTICVVSVAAVALAADAPPLSLPGTAVQSLKTSLSEAAPHRDHLWRDTAPTERDGTVTAYIEIPKGERRKFEFRMGENRVAIDRVMPEGLGGYPINYGFVPQTVSYDGDPFDALVLGPPLPVGETTRGLIVGLLLMDDEKGHDAKVVLSPADHGGSPRYELTAADRQQLSDFFGRYKAHEPGKFSRVGGWGAAADGLAYVTLTHRFFTECRSAASACTLSR